jgi:hypothetical protein
MFPAISLPGMAQLKPARLHVTPATATNADVFFTPNLLGVKFSAGLGQFQSDQKTFRRSLVRHLFALLISELF